MSEPEELSVEAIRKAPFPLFGLPEDFAGPRWVASEGGEPDDSVYLVSLAHGERDAPDAWIEVGVIGPIHRRDARGCLLEIDPDSVPAFSLVANAHPGRSGPELVKLRQKLVDAGFDQLELSVDDNPKTFRSLRCGEHWMAITDLEPDHALYVCASRIEPREIRLVQVIDPEPYIAGTHELDQESQ